MVIAILLLVAGVIYQSWDQIKPMLTGSDSGGQGDNDGNTGTSSGTGTPIVPVGLNGSKVLKKGVYDSPEVGKLQQLLNQAQPTNKITVDNDFGSLTEAKLKSVTGLTQITLNQVYSMIMAGFQ